MGVLTLNVRSWLLLDVVVGSNCSKHPGNIKFSQFISAYKKARARANPSIEAAVKEVVVFWRKLSPPGRFLAQNKNIGDGRWYEVGDKQAIRIASFFLMKQSSGSEKRRSKAAEMIRDSTVSRSIQKNGQGQLQQGQFQQQTQVRHCQDQSQPQFNFQGQIRGHGSLQMQAQVQGQQVQNQMQGQGQFQRRGFQLDQGQFQGQLLGSQGQSMNQAQQYQNQGQGLSQDFQGGMTSFQPVPIGSSSAESMGWNSANKQQSQRTLNQDFQNPLSCDTLANSEPDFDPLDFNPIPLNSNNSEEDFDPLPIGFASNTTTNQVQNGTDQVQVSVNMVVNRDTAVNTVTNIQIGTGAGTVLDERNGFLNDGFSKPSSDVFPSSNFQLTTGAPNGFIHISAHTNSQGVVDSMNSGLPTSSANFSNEMGNTGQLNDFQNAFSGGFDSRGDAITVATRNKNQFQGSMSMNNNTMHCEEAWSDVVGSSPASLKNENRVAQANKNKVGDAVPCAASLLSCLDEW